jgi:hypothetical protein
VSRQPRAVETARVPLPLNRLPPESSPIHSTSTLWGCQHPLAKGPDCGLCFRDISETPTPRVSPTSLHSYPISASSIFWWQPRRFEMPSILVLSAAGAATVYLVLRALLHVLHDEREPPAVETAIPFITPLIGMMREKNKYHIRLRYRCSRLFFLKKKIIPGQG